MGTMSTAPVTRRQRHRDATVEEIKTVARDLMVREGSSSLNLRAVAREMGMTASAIYRYFPGRDAILTALITDAYDAVGEAVEKAMAGAPRDRTATAILAGVHAFRRWALDHPQEYGLIYGTPVPGYDAPELATLEPAMRTSFALLGELLRGTAEGMITPPRDDLLPEPVHATMAALLQNESKSALGLTPATWALALQFWILLYGAISSEVFGHLPQMLAADSGPFFDFSIRRALVVIGLDPQAVDDGVSPPF